MDGQPEIFHQKDENGALHYAARCSSVAALGIFRRVSATRASAELSYWPSSAPPLFHVFSRIATANTLLSVPPGSGSGLLDILDGAGNHVLQCCCPFPRDQWRFISWLNLETQPEAASTVAVLARMRLPLHYACESASLQTRRSWSSCCKRILLASPSIIAITAPLEVCHTVRRCGCRAALAGSGLGAGE
jgi:hypothetical protein